MGGARPTGIRRPAGHPVDTRPASDGGSDSALADAEPVGPMSPATVVSAEPGHYPHRILGSQRVIIGTGVTLGGRSSYEST